MLPDSLPDLVDRYVQAWNQPDADCRRVELGALYNQDASLVTQSAEFVGLSAVVEHISQVFDEFIGSGRYLFRSGGAIAHHRCVLFRWEMTDASSGSLVDAGMNALLLSLDGKITGDYQFVLGIESSIGPLATLAP